MKSQLIFIVALVLIISACAPTPPPQLPDLTVSSLYVSLVDSYGYCLGNYMLILKLTNQGSAPADGVTAVETASGQTVVIGRLEAGQSLDMNLPALWTPGTYTIQLDPENAITESNENNNALSTLGLTPTPPVDCIPGGGQSVETPIPTNTLPPTITATPTTQSDHFPMFFAPADWKTYSNANPPYEIQYPPDATLEAQAERLIINVPFQVGTQMIEKNVWIETRIAPPEGCLGIMPWQGTASLNGVDFQYIEEPGWQHAMGGLSFLLNMYSTSRNGFCFTVSLRIGQRDDSGMTGAAPLPTPSRADVDMEVLLDIFLTLRIP